MTRGRATSVLYRVRAAHKRRTVGEIEAMAAELVANHDPVKYLSRAEATNVVRGIFRRCGYAVAEHGTKGQDLDLIAVPWTDRAGIPARIVDEVVEALEGTVLRAAEPGEKPHGRLVWTIVPGGRRPHDLWYLDLGVMCPDKYREDAQ